MRTAGQETLWDDDHFVLSRGFDADGRAPNPFSSDDFLRRRRVRSVLCLPLVKEAQLIGVLYLENGLTPHVLTPDRIAILCLLASQAAISLENARLYGELRDAEHALSEAQRLSHTGSFRLTPSTGHASALAGVITRVMGGARGSVTLQFDGPSNLLDAPSLLAACGEDDVILGRVTSELREQVPATLESMQAAWRIGEAAALREAAHKLHGMIEIAPHATGAPDRDRLRPEPGPAGHHTASRCRERGARALKRPALARTFVGTLLALDRAT